MTFYRDLTDYEYHSEFVRPETKNVGWLALGHEFEIAEPTEVLLRELWKFCKISVAQSRGVHECDFCPGEHSQYAERNGESLLLGTAEIRVFSKDGGLYAAPTLVYHYVKDHSYKPPDQFIEAMASGAAPPSKEYFDELTRLGLKWRNTPAPQGNRFKVDPRSPER